MFAFTGRHFTMLSNYKKLSGDEIPERDRVSKCGVGYCTPKTVNAAGFYPLLLVLFILTSILHSHFLAQTI